MSLRGKKPFLNFLSIFLTFFAVYIICIFEQIILCHEFFPWYLKKKKRCFPLEIFSSKRLSPERGLYAPNRKTQHLAFAPWSSNPSLYLNWTWSNVPRSTSLFFHPKREAGEGEGADGPSQSWSLTFLPFWLTWTPCRPAARGWKTCGLWGPLTHPCSTSTAYIAWVSFGDTGYTTLRELLFFFFFKLVFFAKLCLIYTVNNT